MCQPCKHEQMTSITVNIWNIFVEFWGPYYGDFFKSIKAFPKISNDFPYKNLQYILGLSASVDEASTTTPPPPPHRLPT